MVAANIELIGVSACILVDDVVGHAVVGVGSGIADIWIGIKLQKLSRGGVDRRQGGTVAATGKGIGEPGESG